MLISRFYGHYENYTIHAFLEYTTYIKHDLSELKVEYKASLLGSIFHPFIIHYLILVAYSQFDSVMGLFLIWKAFCSYQVKEKRKQKLIMH